MAKDVRSEPLAAPAAQAAREAFIAWQDAWLIGAALHEADSGGRAVPEPEHPYRTAYQRDRDRIIHCSSFRRLDYKTQVFVPHEQDHYRTRMTHTLEVAQVARTLARALRANEDVCEAVALAHDLGHAPFGHAGEAALEELMAAHDHFEHNRQSLRVVDYLEHPYSQFRGLNLTTAVRRCLAKHRTVYDVPLEQEFADGLLGPLEGQLVDLADEIAFTSSDLFDALSAGWLQIADLEHLELWRAAWGRAEAALPQAQTIHKRIRACGNVLAMMADDCIEQTRRRIESAGLARSLAVQSAPDRTAAFSQAMLAMVKPLQALLLERVYRHEKALEKDAEARSVITGLFAAYLRELTLLPERYRSRTDADGLHRVICDYVAGMTDRFCLQQFLMIAK
jgi:dGTPase